MDTISFKGEIYIKGSKIAKELGYTADYVGQLCRSGQVQGTLVGRSWYVSEKSIRSHKKTRYRSNQTKSLNEVRRMVSKVQQAVYQMCDKHKLEMDRVLGLGVGAVGPLDRNKGTILNPLYFPASGWNQVPIVELLERAIGVQVVLDNGANMALLAEYWAGAPQEYRHLLYVRAGVGLRSAMISNGSLVYGAVDMEGSVGHMIIQTDGRQHPERPHVYGCLESYVSIPVLEEQARSKLKQGRRSVLSELVTNPGHVEFNHLLQALRQDDRMVTELFIQAATFFGIGLSNLLNILHPERVILGGPLVTSNELFYQTCTQVALKNTLYYPAYPVSFSRGRLSEEALAVGAAAMIVNHLVE